MKKKAQKRQKPVVIEHIKTVVMGALLINLIALVIVYVLGMRLNQTGSGRSDLGEDFDRLWSAQSGETPEGLEKSRLIPEFIGYKQAAAKSASAAFADTNALSALYEITSPCILELFGSGSVCRALPHEEGANLFTLACEKDEFVYIRYHTPVLYQLIYAYAADKLTVFEGDVAVGDGGAIGAYIGEMIIVPDSDFAAHRFTAYAHDGDGNYYEFSQGKHIVSSDFYISKLASDANNINTLEFYFASGGNFAGVQPIICEDVESLHLTSENALISDVERDALLTLFGYNLDKLSGYSDENGYVYVDTHSQLRVNEGYVSFLADDAGPSASSSFRGISIDSLLGYTSSAASGLFDKLTAVDNLIGKLGEISPSLIGAHGKLCLGDVYSENGLLVVEYYLTFNGILVDSKPYFRAVLTDQTVCEVAVHAQNQIPSEDSDLLPGAKYTVETLLGAGELANDAGISAVKLCYRNGDARWNVILDK